MASTSRRTRDTTWLCSAGHEFYSYSTTALTHCYYPRCDGTVRAVKGLLAPKKGAVK